MKKIISILSLVMFLGLATARAEESKPLPPDIIALDEMALEIDQSLKGLAPEAIKSANIYLQALARIKASREFLIKNPKSKQAPDIMAACRLLTETAVLEIKTRDNEYRTSGLEAQRETRLEQIYALVDQINARQEKISDMESQQITKFKADLAREKRKYDDVREQAKVQFSKLESELIKVKNEAHRTIISMSDLLFETGKADVTETLGISLAKIAGILTVFRETNVTVEGHTDNVGSEEYNQKLSQARAENVKAFLISQGIVEDRLTAVGYNFSRPVADNETKEGRARNRRVDLVIVGKEVTPSAPAKP